ncbi:tetratricopeptide repeat protein 16-like [Tropilaelaps mercedesae]|uniref:Tetratricopeptide repeat protein 16-like n=1 Tax=Tropilaelaps mercedesae TaxID=418985 RepID=A0A1V9X353_9ACAR|nr:tetratricopeptide repeat protein 16-like [Tropilaelaps mercedesae]
MSSSKSKSSTKLLWDVLSRSLGFDSNPRPKPAPAPSQGPAPAPSQGPAPAPSQGPAHAPSQGPAHAPSQGPAPAPSQEPAPSAGAGAVRKPEDGSAKETSGESHPSLNFNQRPVSILTRMRSSFSKARSHRSSSASRKASCPRLRTSHSGSSTAKFNKATTKTRTPKVQFSASSECILSPNIVRYGFSKPGRREQRRLRRLAERGRLYMQKHGKELPEEYMERTPTSLISEMQRREEQRKNKKRMGKILTSTHSVSGSACGSSVKSNLRLSKNLPGASRISVSDD